MTLQETTLNRFHELSENLPTYTGIFTEADGGLTYYELRQFMAMLLKQSRNADTKKVVDDLYKTITKLEIMNITIPTIKKQKSLSPKVF